MSSEKEPLERIAVALEQLAPAATGAPDWMSAPAYVWSDREVRAIAQVEAPPLALLRGIDAQKQKIVSNVERLANKHAAHDMLLWGARGMGKSALIRSAVASAQHHRAERLALVQIAQDALPGLSRLFIEIAAQPRQFVVYIDDLGFAEDDSTGPRLLRSWLEGGVEARPANVRLAVTSNRRAIVPRHHAEQDDPVNPRDALDDKLALADRFGLSVGFHDCSQEDYLDIVAGYAKAHSLDWEQGDALEWAKRRGARSGRIAWHYVVELAGLAGKSV